MAKNSKIAILTNSVLIVALLLIVSVVESREIGYAVVKGTKSISSPVVCTGVYQVAKGDTCSSVTQGFGLTTELFNSFNPNLPCDSLFVGQWLCVTGNA